MAKEALNALHQEMAAGQYTERHVHEENGYLSIHRQNALTHEGYLLITRTAFKDVDTSTPVPFRVAGHLQLHFAATLTCRTAEYKEDPARVNGVPSDLTVWQAGDKLPLIEVQPLSDGKQKEQILRPTSQFAPGGIVIYKTSLGPQQGDVLTALQKQLSLTENGTWHLDGIIRTALPALDKALAAFSLDDFNVLLYRTDDEEKDVHGTLNLYLMNVMW